MYMHQTQLTSVSFMQSKRSTEKGIGIWSIENYANDFNTSSSTNSNHTKQTLPLLKIIQTIIRKVT